MSKLFFFALLLVNLCLTQPLVATSASPKTPFARFLKLEKQDKSKEAMQSAFEKERQRLGPQFETELLKLVAGHKQRCHQLAVYLEQPQNSKKHQPDYKLALRLIELGLEVDLEDDFDHNCRNYPMLLRAAILAEKAKLHERSLDFIRQTQQLKKADETSKIGSYCWPIMNEANQELIVKLFAEVIAKDKEVTEPIVKNKKFTNKAPIDPSKPFSEFLVDEDYWKHREKLARLFQQERLKLGDKFKPELLKLVQGNQERCYWLSSFLSASSYLEGHKPDLPLALEVLEIGIELKEDLCTTYSTLVNATFIAEKLGLREKAITYCLRYQKLSEEDDSGMTGGCFPAFSEADHQLIDKIERIAEKQ